MTILGEDARYDQEKDCGVIFTRPEAGFVGLSLEQAKAELGQAKVVQTIAGMEAIREATDAAERVIRGLGVRTKEIGGILDVIDDVAHEGLKAALERLKKAHEPEGLPQSIEAFGIDGKRSGMMRHRGPDWSGVYVADHAILAHERLARALRSATLAGDLVPVTCGSAFRNKAVQPLLNAVIDYLPSPLDVVDYMGFKPGDETETRDIARRADDDMAFSGLAFKIMNDPFVGSLTFTRVYSGVLKKGDTMLNSTKGKKERVGRMMMMHSNNREEIEEAFAGDIIALAGLKETTTGDTLCDPAKPVVLETMTFPDPVIEIAVEPKSKADQEKMALALQRLAIADGHHQQQPAQGHGGELEAVETYRGTTVKMELVDKVRLDIGVSDPFVEPTVEALIGAARTGEVGDGKIFVLPVERAIRIRTGETDTDAVTPEPNAGAAQL